MAYVFHVYLTTFTAFIFWVCCFKRVYIFQLYTQVVLSGTKVKKIHIWGILCLALAK